ncbi:transporter substrate-binding domain-containing protein [Streptomyces yaizuensis]|uniref:Transporter substrate-binding domain-containing protein n=1 Tax=Streptomyces yaizuensis TaxID=2989713 RepID=A0ABQ5NXJ8_9ACTN|nr:transporter substrate-binding domain-containing protein [Streptomyces sp. YSPA8]GLF95099.1 transporter substrate-binding domain-containing protein [Streptomyces sp. YSPA8]
MYGTPHRRLAVRTGAGVAALAATALAGCSSDPPSLLTGKVIEVGVKRDQPGTSFSPFAGEFEGFDVKVARELLSSVGVKDPSFEGILSKHRASVLQKGHVQFVAATFSINQERMAPKGEMEGAENLDFVGPYAATKQGFLVRKDESARYKHLRDFRGKVVCVWEGTTSGSALDEIKETYGITTVTEMDAAQCVNKLRAEETEAVDAVSTDQLILYGFMEEHPELAVASGVTFGADNRYGVAMKKGYREDCKKLQRALVDYVNSNDWEADFLLELGSVPREIRKKAKPQVADIENLSCRDEPGIKQVG